MINFLGKIHAFVSGLMYSFAFDPVLKEPSQFRQVCWCMGCGVIMKKKPLAISSMLFVFGHACNAAVFVLTGSASVHWSAPSLTGGEATTTKPWQLSFQGIPQNYTISSVTAVLETKVLWSGTVVSLGNSNSETVVTAQAKSHLPFAGVDISTDSGTFRNQFVLGPSGSAQWGPEQRNVSSTSQPLAASDFARFYGNVVVDGNSPLIVSHTLLEGQHLSQSGQVFDLVQTATFTVTATPVGEPTSACLLAGWLAMRVRRRRNNRL